MNVRIKSAFVVVGVAAVALLAGGEALSKAPAVVPSSAHPLATVPVTVPGVANGRSEAGAPTISCAAVDGAQWYTVKAPHRGAMVAKLVARGDLDAAIEVYRVVRSQRLPVLCAPTNRHGRARLAWYAHTDGSYLIGVARRTGSAVGPYELSVLAAEKPERAPGTPLAAVGVQGTVNGVLDTSDAWAVTMNRGTTYRLNLTKPSRIGCMAYQLFRPGIPSFLHAKPVLTMDCGGYAEFTPGVDGGGVYSVLVTTDRSDAINHAYRLQVAPAGQDDTAPGVKLENGQFVSGTIAGRGIDAVDMYRFAVPRTNEQTTVELHQKANVGFDLLVLDETGARVARVPGGRGLQVLRLHIPSGPRRDRPLRSARRLALRPARDGPGRFVRGLHDSVDAAECRPLPGSRTVRRKSVQQLQRKRLRAHARDRATRVAAGRWGVPARARPTVTRRIKPVSQRCRTTS